MPNINAAATWSNFTTISFVSAAVSIAMPVSPTWASPEIRGVVRPETAASISTELVAHIESMPLKVGASFNKGDVLVAFDCRRYKADLKAANAEAKSLSITVDQNRLLVRHRAGGINELKIAKANYERAKATAESLRIRLDQCTIRAPYDGRVAERLVDAYEISATNKPLMKIVKKGNLEIDLIVPSSWMVWLQKGQEFEFKIDETKKSYKAHIMHLGAVIDPISRTMSVLARFLESDSHVRPGMSGEAKIEVPNG